MIAIGLLGATGRMGGWVLELLKKDYTSTLKLGCAVGHYENENELEPLLRTDAVIDFSLPEAVLPFVRVALQSQFPKLPVLVVASTGWKPQQLAELEELALRTPVLMSSNFSTGVLALHQILENAAPLLRKLGYAPVLVDTHHRHKKDAPSGTALMLARAMEGAAPAVQIKSVRAGEIIGDHEVTFYGPGDHIVLGHFAQDRSIFARGALDAAVWLSRRKRGTHGILTLNDYFAESLLQ